MRGLDVDGEHGVEVIIDRWEGQYTEFCVVRHLTSERVAWKGPFGERYEGEAACVEKGHFSRCEARRQCTNVFEPNERPRATPMTHVDERNLCLKRREIEQVKVADTLDPKGRCLCLTAHISVRGILLHTRRIAGSYGSLEHFHTELGNSETA